MSMAVLMKEMADAGAPMEAIIIAVRAIEAKDAQLAEKRAVERDRKRRQRDVSRDSHGTVTGQSEDIVVSTPSLPSPQTPQPTHPREEKSRARKGTRFPDSWKPQILVSGKAGEAAGRRGEDWLRSEFEKFGNYFKSEGKSKLDWQLTWANWVISSDERQPLARGQPPAATGNELFVQASRYGRAS